MRIAVALLICSAPAFACKCIAAYPVCNEVEHSDRVFAGTVISITPALLDPWSRIGDGPQLPAAEVAALQKDPSAQAVARLKEIYLDLLRDTNAESRRRIVSAATHAELDQAFEAITSKGRVVRFHVDKWWKSEEEDEKKTTIDVFTGTGDCGVAFQRGETWLVYADEDEETSTLETSICTRTRRLTEAGGDLAYLFHYEETPKSSTRIEGFVSTDVRDQFRGWDPAPLSAPAGGLTVRLSGEDRNLYAASAPDGRYIFDGLPDGDYQLFVYAKGFPEVFRVISGPHAVKLEERSCRREILIVPR
jgi:hypothetical protein